MNVTRLTLVAAAIALSACTPAKLVRPQAVEEGRRAEVMVFRDSQLNAGGVTMVLGVNDKEYAQMGTREYVRWFVQAGPQTIFVRSTQADKPFKLPVDLAAGSFTCLKASADPANFAKMLVPFVMHMTSTFMLEKVDCPTTALLDRFERLEIRYDGQPATASAK